MHPMQRHVIVCVAIILAIAAIYSSAVRFDFVNYDDPWLVSDNPHIKNGLTWDAVRWAFTDNQYDWWHPLTWLSHMADIQFFGLKPGYHHLTSILLHACNALLLYAALLALTRSVWASAFSAAIFAVHPMHVESVAWVAERKDVLSGLFWCLTLLSYAYWARTGHKRWYGLSLVAFVLGLMAKPMLVTIPFVLLLLDFWPLGRCKSVASIPTSSPIKKLSVVQLVVEKIPFFVGSGLSSVITMIGQKQAGGIVDAASIPFSSRILNAITAYAAYLGKCIWPTNLSVFYPYPESFGTLQVALALAVLGAGTIIMLWKWRTMPWLATGWLWFLGTLVPVIGLVQVSERAMADRFSYIPYMGLYLLLTWSLAHLLRSDRRKQQALVIAGVAAIMALGITAHGQVQHWKDSRSLFEQALRATSRNYIAHINLGESLLAAGQTDAAIEHYRAALTIRPYHAKAHNNLGVALVKKGQLDEAIPHYQSAIASQPDYANAYHNLGLAYFRKRQPKEAAQYYQKALEYNPQYAEARVNLGLALIPLNDLDAAISQFQKATTINPRLPQAQYGWGLALERQGHIAAALEHYRLALRLNPKFDSALKAVARLENQTGQSSR
jgi:tetratricopeptide (TPR) repeat protein